MLFTIDTALAIVGIVIGLAAVAMAIPPLFQMIFGRPQLEFKADEFAGPDGKLLLIGVKNERIKSRFLRKIGVEREVGNLLAYLDIQEQGTGKFVAKDISARLSNTATREEGLSVRALPLCTVGVLVVHAHDSHTGIVDARSDELRPISEGEYTAHATIVCGEKVHQLKKSFKVGKAEHLTIWV
jgi:hypothetical protein